uniref:Glycosyltransferase family 2 protein n=1 Tax=Phenylobacterium glaciei TaxID=2803784 RepID=A0A974P2G2_9CAUL|nr:glycosyltransferase family 2 protein [Phenylobacterium glaciei]
MTRLALVMIARDEAHQIARALKSAKPFVDAMIVLDTGSVDGTQAIARACGAEVHDFAWCDDFAAARNASLALSPADWNLVLDADEWIESGGEALAELEPDAMGWVRRDNQLEDEAVSQTWIPRVLPKGVRYEGRIHEQPVGLERGAAAGPAGARRVHRREPGAQGGPQRGPADGRPAGSSAGPLSLVPAGQGASGAGPSAPGGALLHRGAAAGAERAPWRHSLVVRGLTALKDAGRLEEARALAEAERDAWDGSPDFHFAVGNLYLDCAMADPERAVSDLLPVAEAAWKRCLEIGEQPHLDGAVRGRGSFMAAHNLTTLYETFGPPEAAATYRVLAARR